MASGAGRFAPLRENAFSGRTRLFASSVFAGGRLGAVSRLSSDLVPDQAAQAANARGDVAVAWIERRRGERARLGLALRRRGAWFGPARTLATGAGVVAWGAQDPGEPVDVPFVVSAAVPSPGTHRSGTRQVLDAGGTLDRPEGRVRIASGLRGTVAVLWTQTLRGGRVVRTSQRVTGRRFAARTEFEAGTGDAFDADLAIAPDDRRALVWIEQRDLDQPVRAARVSPSRTASRLEVVSPFEDASTPSIAFDPHGGSPPCGPRSRRRWARRSAAPSGPPRPERSLSPRAPPAPRRP